jgi:hypothetical protein
MTMQNLASSFPVLSEAQAFKAKCEKFGAKCEVSQVVEGNIVLFVVNLTLKKV